MDFFKIEIQELLHQKEKYEKLQQEYGILFRTYNDLVEERLNSLKRHVFKCESKQIQLVKCDGCKEDFCLYCHINMCYTCKKMIDKHCNCCQSTCDICQTPQCLDCVVKCSDCEREVCLSCSDRHYTKHQGVIYCHFCINDIINDT